MIVTNSMDVGGVETNIVGLARHLVARGHAVTVMSSGGVLEQELRDSGAQHVRAPIDLHLVPSLLKAAVRVRSLVATDRIAITHAMSAAANLVLALANTRSEAVHITSPMGLQNAPDEPALRTRLRARLHVFRAQRVFTISGEIERILRAVRVPSQRLIRCDLVGVDPEVFGRPRPAAIDALRVELRIPVGTPVVTTIGALHSRKSHHLFVAAAAEIHRAIPDCRFLVVGEGPERSPLEAQIAHLGLERDVQLTGQRRDTAAILGLTTVYVKPGVVEGFIGITVLEAMAARVPVVAFDTADVRDAISPGTTGVLADAGSPSALANAIIALLGSPSCRRELSEAAVELIQARFSFGGIVTTLEQRYSDALNDFRRVI